MNKIYIVIIILCAICFQNVFAQQVYSNMDTSNNFVFHFRFDKHIVDSGYMNNNKTLKKIDSIFFNEKIRHSLNSIHVFASSSLSGRLERNRWLSKQRSRAVKGYIEWKYPHIDQSLIQTTETDENWSGLRKLVEADPNVPSREKVLAVIDTDINLATKKWRLKQIKNGESWHYVERHFFKELRSSVICVVLYKKNIEMLESKVDSIRIPEVKEETKKTFVEEILSPSVETLPLEKTLFAIKTNLLADVLSIANIEIEVPIGERWSVSGELITPWWRKSNSNWTMQMLAGNGAVKYWLGDRSQSDLLMGWSLGLYGGGGKYDLQLFDKEGKQGEFFNTGLQGGYAHKIGKKLRLEYSLSLGFLRSDYKEYTKVKDTKYGDIKVFEFPWEVKRLHWIGPTNAKISLVWVLNYKSKKGGDQK